MNFTDSQLAMAYTLAEYWGDRRGSRADAISRLVKRLYHSLDCNARLFKEIVLMKIREINLDNTHGKAVGKEMFRNQGIDNLNNFQKNSRNLARKLTRTIVNPRLYDLAEQVPADVYVFELLKKSDVATLHDANGIESSSEESSSEHSGSSGSDSDAGDNEEEDEEDEEENEENEEDEEDNESSSSDESAYIEPPARKQTSKQNTNNKNNKRIVLDLVSDEEEKDNIEIDDAFAEKFNVRPTKRGKSA